MPPPLTPIKGLSRHAAMDRGWGPRGGAKSLHIRARGWGEKPLRSLQRPGAAGFRTVARNMAPIWIENHQIAACEGGRILLNPRLPNFARACGRVSIGRSPDKRPESYQNDRQPEGTGPPRSSRGGRDLKQRRSGLFWSRSALQRSALLKRHYILPAVRSGISHSKRAHSTQRLTSACCRCERSNAVRREDAAG